MRNRACDLKRRSLGPAIAGGVLGALPLAVLAANTTLNAVPGNRKAAIWASLGGLLLGGFAGSSLGSLAQRTRRLEACFDRDE